MKLENQVSSFKLSKKLKELGVKQESLWSWKVGGKLTEQSKSHLVDTAKWKRTMFSADQAWSSYSAYTVAELGEGLPIGWITARTATGEFLCCPYKALSNNDWNDQKFRGGTEADARAKARIWLIENGHITP